MLPVVAVRLPSVTAYEQSIEWEQVSLGRLRQQQQQQQQQQQ